MVWAIQRSSNCTVAVAAPKRGRVYASRQGPRHKHQLLDRGGSTAHEPSNDDDYDGAKHGDQNTSRFKPVTSTPIN
jgi:hypothetical protein